MSLIWGGSLDMAGERNRDAETDARPLPKHEPGPDDPEPDDETQDLVRPVKA